MTWGTDSKDVLILTGLAFGFAVALWFRPSGEAAPAFGAVAIASMFCFTSAGWIYAARAQDKQQVGAIAASALLLLVTLFVLLAAFVALDHF